MSFPFKIPFAASGDQSTVPDSDLTGSVNFTEGYTPDYQADPSSDPNAKLIERDKFNFLMNKITGAVGEIQRQGVADWYADLAPYDLNAEVFYNGKRWRSTIANNSAVPESGPEWLDVTPGTIASKNAATTQEALDGEADKFPDAAGVHSAIGRVGLGGTAQSWQDVSSSRSAGVIYTNNTGIPIEVQIYAQAQAGSTNTLVVDGVDVSSLLNNSVGMLSCIVPAGSAYTLPNIGFLYRWVELR